MSFAVCFLLGTILGILFNSLIYSYNKRKTKEEIKRLQRKINNLDGVINFAISEGKLGVNYTPPHREWMKNI